MMQTARFQDAMPELRGARLILTDPPYNKGFDYGDVADNQDPADYAAMIADFVQLAYEAAADDAHLMVIHYPEHFAEHWQTYTGNGWRFHQWLTWVYPAHEFGSEKRYRRASRTILWLQKGAPEVQMRAVPQPYRQPSDKRVRNAKAKGYAGAVPWDWFEINPVKAGSKEHKGYSNQIPQALLHRLILTTTNPGDLVADPFSGTGSTVRAALALDREGWGCDANPDTARFWGDLDTRQRLLVSSTLEERP